MKWWVFTLLVLMILPGCGSRKAAPPRRDYSGCNLLMVSLDTLRRDRLGVNGCPDPVSPFMDALSRHAVVFTDVFAQSPSTVRSHRAIFNSRYVYAQTMPFPSPEHTLAGILTRHGRITAGIVDGGLMHRKFGNNAGFQSWDDTGGGFRAIYPKAREWLRTHGQSPFFLFLHTYDIHYPYTPPPPFDTMFMPDEKPWFHLGAEYGHNYFNQIDLKPPDYRFIDGRYKGGVRYCDGIIASLFETLRQTGLLDTTIVAIISDHGESLGERGYVGHNQLYNAQLRVPAILFLPPGYSRLAGGPVETIDLMPTLLDLLTVPRPADLQGVSAVPGLFGGAGPRDDRFRLSETADHMVHSPDGWKLIVRHTPGRDELYDTVSDPTEIANIASAHPERSKTLETGLTALTGKPVDALRTAKSNTMIHIPLMKPGGENGKLLEQLKNLGYVN